MVAHSIIPEQVAESPTSLGVKNDVEKVPFAYLGTTTKSSSLQAQNVEKKSDFVVADESQLTRVLDRFYLRALAKELLPDHRIGICGYFLAFNKDHVKVVYRRERRIASFQNLAHCHALWICAPCASVITEKRRDELKTAFENHNGEVVLATFTIRHKSNQSLKEVLKTLDDSYHHFLNGKYGRQWREEYGVIGTVKALEVTWGVNGWHPHLHVLYFGRFTQSEVEIEEASLKTRWIETVKRFGGSATYDNGFTLKDDKHFLREYIAKYGHEPTRELWNLESEVSKANVKKGRGHHYTPFELLRMYGDGWKPAGELFKEFAKTFHGKKQMIWTRGLKKLLGVDDVTDKEILDAENENPYEVLAILTGHEWRRVREQRLEGSLLIVASNGDIPKLEAFLKSKYIR